MNLPNLAASKIAIACSGGIDSMCLAFLAAQNNDIIALIIDHNLRNESKIEADKTSQILSGLGIENVILKGEEPINSNIQAGARKMRYDLLSNYCKANGIGILATAHHADDNAETILLKISRGSGVDGLTGILPETQRDGIKIIRPLLKYKKHELQQILEENNIKWVEDPTNKTDEYNRNKLRQALAEIEDSELITDRLNDMASNMLRVRNYLEAQTEQAFEAVVSGRFLDVVAFKNLHDEIAYRLLVKIIMQFSNAEQRPRFEKIKLLKTAIENGDKKTLSGLQFTPQADKILITLENKN